jgi:hypothetical protein
MVCLRQHDFLDCCKEWIAERKEKKRLADLPQAKQLRLEKRLAAAEKKRAMKEQEQVSVSVWHALVQFLVRTLYNCI